MPWKPIVAGEEALATDAQNLFMDQVVAQFVDAAQRTTQLPAPKKGQMSTLESHAGAVFIWSGTAWQEVVPYMQYGSGYFTTNDGGGAVVYFPVPFAAPPTCVQLTNNSSSGYELFVVAVIYEQITPTGFGFVVRRATTDQPWSNGGVRVSWTAWGVRA